MRPAFPLLLTLLLALTVHAPASASGLPLVDAARQQIGITLIYDGRYQRLDYPLGDVPIERGVCTDVVIRAYRQLGLDLQQRVHEDMRANFAAYPALWGLSRPDRNIDHRRVPNLQTWLKRQGALQEISADPRHYQPGDLVTWMLPGNLPHIGIVSDQRNAAGVPLILHNIGAGAREDDILFVYPMTGHYRLSAGNAAAASAI